MCLHFNKSVFNWTFCQLLMEIPNCTKIYYTNCVNSTGKKLFNIWLTFYTSSLIKKFIKSEQIFSLKMVYNNSFLQYIMQRVSDTWKNDGLKEEYWVSLFASSVFVIISVFECVFLNILKFVNKHVVKMLLIWCTRLWV
jgi:hypothetical protein